jgi:hypothetical protein
MSKDWERRNQALNRIREGLKQDPANLELANQYWVALSGDRGEDDYRSGQNVTEAYREAALRSTEGAVAFARAYRQLFTVSGEPPRIAYLDEPLIQALKGCVSQLPESDRSAIEWVLGWIRE